MNIGDNRSDEDAALGRISNPGASPTATGRSPSHVVSDRWGQRRPHDLMSSGSATEGAATDVLDRLQRMDDEAFEHFVGDLWVRQG